MKSPKVNTSEIYYPGCSRGKQVRSNYVVGCGDRLRDEVLSTSLTAAAVAVHSVLYVGLPNGHNIDGLGKILKCFGLDLYLST